MTNLIFKGQFPKTLLRGCFINANMMLISPKNEIFGNTSSNTGRGKSKKLQ